MAILLFNSCKENGNKNRQNQGILSHKHKSKPLPSPKHSPRAVASLTVPGGQDFHFPHFFLIFG